MTVGVNGFIGERLIEAREARGIMTQSHLAELLGVSKNAISLYESNKNSPQPKMLIELSKLLKVKETFFCMQLPQDTYKPIFWRSNHVSVKDSRTVAKRKYAWSSWLIDCYLKSYLEMPELNLPTKKELGVPNDPTKLTNEDIEKITIILRKHWGIGLLPIDNLIALLENNGLLVAYANLDSNKLDAFSTISEYDDSFHIRLGLDKGSVARSRFDAAHELAHLVLHSHLPKSYFNKENHSFVEAQANYFASAFLLPYESFKKDVWMTSIEAFKVLKEQWKVSVGAIIKRCDDIGLFGLDESKVQRLWINYRRNWEAIESDTWEFEKPQLMKRSIDLLLESKIKTKSQILYEVPFTQDDIESLLNLPLDYLSDDFGELKHLPVVKSKIDSYSSSEQDASSAKVISFEGRRKF